MRGRVARQYCSTAGTAMLVMMLLMSISMTVLVDSARLVSVREMVAAIEQRGTPLVTTSEEYYAGGATQWPETSTSTSTSTSNPGSVDLIWDAEAESPPAQRQRDRSLWGMSKRLVPSGPNPLHN